MLGGKHRLALRTANLSRRELRSAFSAIHAWIAHVIGSFSYSIPHRTRAAQPLLFMPRTPLFPRPLARFFGNRGFAQRAGLEIHERTRTAFRAHDHLGLAVLACRQTHVAIRHNRSFRVAYRYSKRTSAGGVDEPRRRALRSQQAARQRRAQSISSSGTVSSRRSSPAKNRQ